MADYSKTNENLETTNDTEPATGKDVGIGGGLGVIGGAIVGGLAGGPIGAIIGAVAGGAVSAGAVDIVDKHDHDNPNAAVANATPVYDNTAGTATAYTGPGDYQRVPGTTVANDYDTDVVPVDETYVDTTPTAGTYADTVPAANTYADTAPRNDSDRTVQLHEEVLSARKDQVQTGEVTLRKEVITETQSIDVPVTREEVVIERHAVSGDAPAGSFDGNTEEVLRVPVMEEQVTIQKTPVVTEEISLGKRQVTETQHLSDTVRREEARIDNPDNVDVVDRN